VLLGILTSALCCLRTSLRQHVAWPVARAHLAAAEAAAAAVGLLLLLCCLQLPDEAESALLALSVAIDHPAFSTDQQVLCGAAQACKAWQLAVQQCGISGTDAVIKLDQQLNKLHSFACWLPKHVHLVRSINVVDDRPVGEPPMAGYPAPSISTQRDRADAAAQLLQRALEAAAAQQHATATPTAAAAAAAIAAAAPVNRGRAAVLDAPKQQQQQQQQGLRLASLLQLLAQPLPLRKLHAVTEAEDSWKMNLVQLTQLQQLHTNNQLAVGSVLPAQLQELILQADTASNEGLRSETFSIVSSLQQLQRLEFRVGFQDPTWLLQLAALPALQHLG
jgi:hypothetical protein